MQFPSTLAGRVHVDTAGRPRTPEWSRPKSTEIGAVESQLAAQDGVERSPLIATHGPSARGGHVRQLRTSLATRQGPTAMGRWRPVEPTGRPRKRTARRWPRMRCGANGNALGGGERTPRTPRERGTPGGPARQRVKGTVGALASAGWAIGSTSAAREDVAGLHRCMPTVPPSKEKSQNTAWDCNRQTQAVTLRE